MGYGDRAARVCGVYVVAAIYILGEAIKSLLLQFSILSLLEMT